MKRTTYKDYKVVVVDDGSTDSSKDFLKKRGVETIDIKKNIYNFSKICNIGIKYAIKKYNPKYIMLYNNDAFVKNTNWLTEIVKVADAENQAGIVSCRILNPDGTLQSIGGVFLNGKNVPIKPGKEKRFHGCIDVDVFPGPAFLIKREVIKKIGMLDENFVVGFEDLDYSLRAKDAGYKVLVTDKASIIHVGSSTHAKLWSMSISAQKVMTYKSIRNYLYFFDKHRDSLTAKQRIRKSLAEVPVVFFSTFLTRTIPKGERHIFGVKKYGSLWNLPAGIKAVVDYNLDKTLNKGAAFSYYKKIKW